MATGYVLIALKQSDEKKVFDRLQRMPEVRESHILFGEWDIIAKIQCDTPEALGDFVMRNIRMQKEIKITSTLIVAK